MHTGGIQARNPSKRGAAGPPLHRATKVVGLLVPSNFPNKKSPVAAYVFFTVFSSPVFHLLTWYRRPFLRKMWLVQLAFLCLTAGRMFPCSLNLRNTSLFFTGWPTNRSVKISAMYKAMLLCTISLVFFLI